jgi:hypothetical protein
MGQISFPDAEYVGKRKKTQREVFAGDDVGGSSPPANGMKRA